MTKKFQVEANGAPYGVYEADNEKGARDAAARDSGYKSAAHMIAKLQGSCELTAICESCPCVGTCGE